MNSDVCVESSALQPEEPSTALSAAERDEPASPPETQPARQPDQETFPDELVALIEREIDRRFQSAKDKRWAQLEKQYGDLHELSQKTAEPLPQPPSSQGHPELEEQLMERAEALLKRLGLRNTPEAAAILRDQGSLEGPGGTLALIDRVLEMALRDFNASQPPAPTPAGMVAPGGGSVDSTDLEAVYRQRRKHIRPGDVNALTALKREFREKGLNIF